jgi:hypothetical protein
MDLSHWLKTPCIDFDFTQNFGKQLLVAPNGGRPCLSLQPKKVRNPHGEEQVVQFRAHYPAGCMSENWADMLFTPLGTEPVARLKKKLPKWHPDKHPEYAAGLDSLIAELYRDNTKIERLEGYLPLFLDQSDESKREPTIDRVRLVYLTDAVEAENPHLALVVFSYYSGYQIRQNGAGSGPPRPGH